MRAAEIGRLAVLIVACDAGRATTGGSRPWRVRRVSSIRTTSRSPSGGGGSDRWSVWATPVCGRTAALRVQASVERLGDTTATAGKGAGCDGRWRVARRKWCQGVCPPSMTTAMESHPQRLGGDCVPRAFSPQLDGALFGNETETDSSAPDQVVGVRCPRSGVCTGDLDRRSGHGSAGGPWASRDAPSS